MNTLEKTVSEIKVYVKMEAGRVRWMNDQNQIAAALEKAEQNQKAAAKTAQKKPE